jgi:hypothetical protein
MLCNHIGDATVAAQDAQHNTQQHQQKPTFVLLPQHPHDPSVEKEYETLIRAWKYQLIDNIPTTPNTDYIRFAWMRLMDHYLDQQWLDSKQMLQCAQAWSARDELSLSEAVHSMNILGLKSMQRSLDARQELLQVLGDPDLMAGFGITTNQQQHTRRRRCDTVSTTSSLITESSEQDVHAPLLVKHNTFTTATPIENSGHDEAIITTAASKEDNDIVNNKKEDYFDNNFVSSGSEELVELSIKENIEESSNAQVVVVDEVIKTRQEFEEQEVQEEDDDISPIASRISSRSISSSMSSPNISSSFDHPRSGFTTRKYESYYQKLHQATSWKEIDMTKGRESAQSSSNEEEDDDLLSVEENEDDSSSLSSSQVSSPLLGSGVQWKSWFLGTSDQQQDEQEEEEHIITITEEFANEKVETDATFAEFHPEFMKKHQQPFLMVRSESSISAFRPISNNLAPRCNQQQNRSFSSLTSQEEEREEEVSPRRTINSKKDRSTSAAKITKSRSFPSKASLSASIKKPFTSASSPPPTPRIPQHQQQQPRNFMIRSIVSKKVSLSKLFGSKKPSTSSTASSSSTNTTSNNTRIP